jgi:hypothetical protein
MFDHIKQQQELVKSNLYGEDAIEKGGEGSKGGKVTGHTKSGKAIYATEDDVSHPDKFEAHLKKHGIKYAESGSSFVMSHEDYKRVREGAPKTKSSTFYDKIPQHTHGTGFGIRGVDSVDKEKESVDKRKVKHEASQQKEKEKAEHDHKQVKRISGDDTLERDGYDANDRPLYISKNKDQQDIEHTTDKKGNVYRHDGVTSKKIGNVNEDIKKSEEGAKKKPSEVKEVKEKKVGKTASDKDIYDNPESDNHKDFTSQDHRDAADLYHSSVGADGKFPGTQRANRNKHLDKALESKKKEDKAKLKNQPSIGDKVTTKEGVGGDVRQRDETHTYIEHKDEEGKTKVSKIKNEELDGKIATGNFTHHKPTNVIKKSETDEVFDELIKGGEGSKGGKVIGHTKSGKPVYEAASKDVKGKTFEEVLAHPEGKKLIEGIEGLDSKRADHKPLYKDYQDQLKKKHSYEYKSDEWDKADQKKESNTDDHDPETPHFKQGDKVTDKKTGKTHTVISHEKGSLQVHTGRNDWHHPNNLTKIKKSEDMTIEKAQQIVNDTLEKGFKGGGAAIGTIKDMGGRNYIKTVTGWKYHGSGGGAKAAEHAVGAGHVGVGHVMGHSPKVNADLESEKVAADKMSDIAFRFKAFAMFTKRVINDGAKSMIAYGTGGVGKTYTVTQQMDAAHKKPFDESEMRPGSDEYDYVKITGKMTAPQVYKTLFQHNGKIIMFDDCDSVLRDGSAINLFKGALDTSGDGTIAYGTSSGVKSDEDPETGEVTKLPNRFKFDGRCIFISNLPADQVPQPLKSRSLKIDLTMTKQQTIDRIKEIATHPKTGKMTNLHFKEVPKYTHEQLVQVIDYLDKNKDHIGDLNVRTVGKMLGIHLDAHDMGEGHSWEQFADQELFSKSDNFFDAGMAKAQRNNILSLYKGRGTREIGKDSTTSGIHIGEDQIEEQEVKEEGYASGKDQSKEDEQEVKKSNTDDLNTAFASLIK